MNDELNAIWSFLLCNELATEDELQLVTSISGYNLETLNGVIYSRTAYHDIQQLYDCEQETFYFSDEILKHIEQ